MLNGEWELIEIAVTFDREGDGGRHHVAVVQANTDAAAVWRDWRNREGILVVVSPQSTSGSLTYDTSWYSPNGEIELCGSGAVAAARVIFDKLTPTADRVLLRGRWHDIVAARSDLRVRIRLPYFNLRPQTPSAAVCGAIGVTCPRSWMTSDELRTVVLPLSSSRELQALEPDFISLRKIRCPGVEALIVTSGEQNARSFQYRYFTPWHGLDESPVAVSANALLGPYWQRQLSANTLTGCQCSAPMPRFTLQVDENGTWVDSPTRDAGHP